jgi:hypothetical protein
MNIIQESINIIRKKAKIIVTIFTILFFGFVFIQNINQYSQKVLFRKAKEIIKENNIILSNTIEYPLIYYFIQNISKYYYSGDWDNFNIKDNIFENKKGKSEVRILKNLKNNYLSGIDYFNSKLVVYFIIKDGEYIDNIFRGNFTFFLPNNLIQSLNESISQNKNLTIYLKSISISYLFGHYFDLIEPKKIYDNEINITFIPKEVNFSNNLDCEKDSTLFSKVHFSIKNKKENISLSFNGNMKGNKFYKGNTLNYSIILTVISIIQIYSSLNFISEMMENVQISLNTDLITMSIEVFWDCLMCSLNFFFALSNENYGYEFGMPSLTLFVLFSILLRILFNAWKSRNIDLMFENISLFRKKLLKFYIIFYFSLLFLLMGIRLIIEYFILVYLLFFSTWFFQIYHSVKNSTKPPMSFEYIFSFTLGKMIIPIYLKAYPYNIFELKPSYTKVIIISLTLLIELIIISLQKILGPKFFIPKYLKGEQYDYYRNNNEINENELENICAICLVKINDDPTKESDIKYELNSSKDNDIFDSDDDEKSSLSEKIINGIKNWKNKITKKPIMITPCHHIYHTICLERSLQSKNICPVCRTKIPPVDDI